MFALSNNADIDLDSMQLPQMNPFPAERSVLVMDNCSIHKSEALRQAVEGAGCRLVFLPPYSPDFNPIENTFSIREYNLRYSSYFATHFFYS